ncbi:DDT domain-containing protein DDR4 [Wolffia australiana]
MLEKRGRGRPPGMKVERRGEEEDDDKVVVLETHPSEFDAGRLQLRSRWELASVLNFLHVFKPIVLRDLKISAEEMEMALMTSDHVLTKIHVALLKGIPPVSKSLEESDVWVTVLSKKLKTWWPWVAEGEAPLSFDDGVEISTYKGLDPLKRLLILKALCEVRLLQDDVLNYVDEEVKRGGHLSRFRKDSIFQDEKGTTYWYDGDSVVGHRLYKNVTKIEYKPRAKGRGRLTLATVEFQWETLATNFKEFRQITDKLLGSKVSSECAVGTIVKDEILPDVEETEKKKERMLKRKQRHARLFEGLQSCDLVNSRRSCRDRRPVSYTFDEYDQSIDEAIQDDGRTGEQESPARATEPDSDAGAEPPLLGLPETRRRLRERPTTNTSYKDPSPRENE